MLLGHSFEQATVPIGIVGKKMENGLNDPAKMVDCY